MTAVLVASLGDPTNAIVGLLGAIVLTYGTIKVAQINKSEASPNPDAVPPAKVPGEVQARADAWRDQTVEMITRLVDAETKIRTLEAGAEAKDAQIRHDAEQIRQDASEIRTLTQRVSDLVAYVRILIVEIKHLHGRPPRPPAGLDLELD